MLKAIKGSAFANIASASRSGPRQRPVESVNATASALATEPQAQRNEADMRNKTENIRKEDASKKASENKQQAKAKEQKQGSVDVYI